ncbi:MAG: 2-oxoacid:acceptor oxidoreductase family protein [Gammaproteobacteria bacterium]|nr:2-oxoacid:acceptor oxidoreductase family protein [Gammaproteobacteria bacterium]NND37909.1 4Fe-4S binding protein [Gammaproteobacteria bacterium]
MYRIRFHGRGGQGIRTASRILGSAFFRAGYHVQDAPRYGAERRGAPIFAYVRAAHDVINERGIIMHPDLVVVVDDSLMSIPAAGVCQGLDERTVLLVVSHEAGGVWAHRLSLSGPIVVLPAIDDAQDRASLPFVGATVAGTAARLLGVIPRESLAGAVADELASLPVAVRDENLTMALRGWETVESQSGIVAAGDARPSDRPASPDWVDSLFEEARISAPVIRDKLTSIEVRTGLWRTMRPVIDYDRCNRCWWVCSTFCPDSAIHVDERGSPTIDYDHCKGCMICVAKCPPHAIAAIPEHEAQRQTANGEVAS